ncbi:response regulator receiver protein [Candidatus Moduliflexus flocculans]|uniref:Response regulator receiver protein n=1 Tax=Candidatus Moduliflexus flocculans TaxID=1499966 RepID=A0A081BLA0_9BACT|nr:response regulator receiver protein [Candidatus Moduliflexus flocculans]
MNRKKILIADDSPTVVDMLTYMFSHLPCEVIAAADGVEAMKLTYSEHPDLILLDILMPNMNGYQVCRLLKDDERTKQIPVVMLTAKDQQSDRFWGMATGADDYIVKDFEDTLLVATVERFLQQETPPVGAMANRAQQEVSTVDVLSHANNLLDRQLFQSTIVNHINQLARSIQDFEETIISVFELLSRILAFQIGAISVLDTKGAQLRLYIYITHTVSPHMVEQVKSLVLKDFSRTFSVKNIETFLLHGLIDDEMEAELLSICENSLIGRNTKIGTMALGDARKGRFSDDDHETFRIASTEVAVVLDNARLYDDNARIHAELERELRRAYDIQTLMLPQENPMQELLTIEATSIPAKDVGGDYYDFYRLNAHQLLVAIGDVTGKGVPAALLMAMIKTALQVRIELTQDVREIMASLNKLVCGQASKQHMTLFLGVLDVSRQTITYCNAGHNFPMLVSRQPRTLTYLEGTALPLGFQPEAVYAAHTAEFGAEDLFFFYSDGIVESRNAHNELYGYPRLEQLLLAHCEEDVLTIYLKLLEQMEAFCHETPQDDDMTMVFLRKIADQVA